MFLIFNLYWKTKFLKTFLAVLCPAINLTNGTAWYSKSAIDGQYPLHTVVFFYCDELYYRSGPFAIICTTTGNCDVQPAICNPSN